MFLARWKWPWPGGYCCPPSSEASVSWLYAEQRMCVTSPLGCVHLCKSVTKSWPGFRRTESHRLGSPLDGQGLARGWEGPLRLSTHSPWPERSPRSSPALAWWKETCQYIHDLRHCWNKGEGAKRGKQEKRQSSWKLNKPLTMHRCWGSGVQRQEVVTLYPGHWVRGNNESQRRQVAGNKERGSLERLSHQPTIDFLPLCWGRRREGRGGLGSRGGVSARGQLHLSTHILHSISHQSGQYGCCRNSAHSQTFLILIPKKLIWRRSFPFSAVSLCSQVAQRGVMHL